ncbi:F0F1-type ATP synthase membrane subunit b/b' [Pantoea agglomerans]|uniref:CAP-Gly protein n=1 Tax=Enterobacter agglomerans TaxID=549 RepID=UPI0013B63B83|nr:CAP-Gly protein [Pantoea agglomerans]MDQ0431125.1 F0F1-type ATP synthase membrane subunit b/b' [Pantoea agglomerans]NEG84681.1 CAP-Gly protein [Pantoea agglomerans]NEH06822.1 CAP-Gly protein [Pantoea agglomerans]
MELVKEMELNRRVSWGSIIAGVVTVMAVSLLLTTLGSSLGFSLLSPQSDDVINGAGKAVMIWSVISIVLSLAAGGFVAGRLAGADGTIHGFLSWATSLLVASVLGFAAAGGILHMAGNAVGAAASVTGSTLSGLGSAAGKASGATADITQSMADRLGLNTQLTAPQTDRQVLEALQKSNIKELQPEFLQSQLEAAGSDIAASVKDLAVNPGNSDAIIDALSGKLKSRAETVSKGVDRDEVKKALTDNTSMSPEEAGRAVDNFIQARDKTVREVSDRMAQLQSNLNEAKAQYAEFKKQAKEKADEAASAAAKIALWSFIALLAGAVISALAGLLGVNTHPAYRKIRA